MSIAIFTLKRTLPLEGATAAGTRLSIFLVKMRFDEDVRSELQLGGL
jgi:hypothetical protein